MVQGKEPRFELTSAAAKEVLRQAIAAGRPAVIRIGLRGGGCSGFSYVFEWVAEEQIGNYENDYQFSYAVQFHPVLVVVDKKSMTFLEGTVLDFVPGIHGHGFKFDNPNVKSTCGCGESIEVK